MIICDKCKFRKECDTKKVLDKSLDPTLIAIIDPDRNCNEFEKG